MSELLDRRLLHALEQALQLQWQAYAGHRLEPLKAKGLAHDHVRICGTGLLARIPKQSQMRLSTLDNLAYQQSCFERASLAGHAPRCIKVLQPCPSLPRGALIVEEIVGRSTQLPHDLPLMAQSMAALHSIILPPPSAVAPLIHASDPLQAMRDEVQAQASYLPLAHLETDVMNQIHAELAAFQALCAAQPRPRRCLIAFDGHPGNFVITSAADGADGAEKAYLVDLEKCRYSYPSLDLAHATLYTSTTWDIDSHTVLSPQEVMATYRAWVKGVDSTLAKDAAGWHLPLRRAMWLWSVTWCAKWRVASRAAAAQQLDGEDWSDENLDPGLAAHVRKRVDHYLSADGVACVRSEFDQLAPYLASV
jgi:Phosphotransferase enzyme family